MQRITIRFTDEQFDKLETLVDAGRYKDRSEAVRTAVIDLLDEEYSEIAAARDATNPVDGDVGFQWRQYP